MKDVIDEFHVSFDIDGLMDSLVNMTVLRTNQLLCFQRQEQKLRDYTQSIAC
jgi:hypothetical protein